MASELELGILQTSRWARGLEELSSWPRVVEIEQRWADHSADDLRHLEEQKLGYSLDRLQGLSRLHLYLWKALVAAFVARADEGLRWTALLS